MNMEHTERMGNMERIIMDFPFNYRMRIYNEFKGLTHENRVVSIYMGDIPKKKNYSIHVIPDYIRNGKYKNDVPYVLINQLNIDKYINKLNKIIETHGNDIYGTIDFTFAFGGELDRYSKPEECIELARCMLKTYAPYFIYFKTIDFTFEFEDIGRFDERAYYHPRDVVISLKFPINYQDLNRDHGLGYNIGCNLISNIINLLKSAIDYSLPSNRGLANNKNDKNYERDFCYEFGYDRIKISNKLDQQICVSYYIGLEYRTHKWDINFGKKILGDFSYYVNVPKSRKLANCCINNIPKNEHIQNNHDYYQNNAYNFCDNIKHKIIQDGYEDSIQDVQTYSGLNNGKVIINLNCVLMSLNYHSCKHGQYIDQPDKMRFCVYIDKIASFTDLLINTGKAHYFILFNLKANNAFIIPILDEYKKNNTLKQDLYSIINTTLTQLIEYIQYLSECCELPIELILTTLIYL